MKFQGELTAIPLADVAQNLATNRKSGALSVRFGDDERHILFQEGAIVSYRESDEISILDWYRDKGLIDEGLLRNAEKKYRRSKRKSLGKIFEQIGALDFETYAAQVREIICDSLYETFSFREGSFVFEERAIRSGEIDRELEAAGVNFAVGSVVMESARRMDDWETVRRCIPSRSEVYHVPPAERNRLVEEHAESPFMLTLIDLLDGTRSIGDVIRSAPAGRFDTCVRLADLVTEKRIRPLAGDELVRSLASSTAAENTSNALERVKAALEREPANQGLLLKVAELSLAAGDADEAAVHYKMLAQSLLDDGDVDGARAELRRSLELNPRDLGVWQKLYGLAEAADDPATLRTLGIEMADEFRRLGLEERARDHLQRMIETFGADIELKRNLADVLTTLGDGNAAVKILLDIVRDELQKGETGAADEALSRVLEIDPKHRRAKEIQQKIRSGQLAKQRARRRTLRRVALAVSCVVALIAYVAYDGIARREFALATREAFASGLSTREDYARARARFAQVQARYPCSLLRFFEGSRILAEIDRRLEREAQPEPAMPAANPPLGARRGEQLPQLSE